jgi:sec-independent protein translocase protein TatC
VAAFAVTYTFHGRLLDWLNRPLPADKRPPLTFGVLEPFTMSIMVSFYAAVLIVLPILFWQLWAFLAPAFEERHQRSMTVLVAFAALLGIGGVAFGYWLILPAAVHFLTNYDKNLYYIQIRARDYLSFAAVVLFAVTIVFEIPIVILGLVRIGILSSAKLRRNRRIGYVVMAAIAVALPGVDPVTTTMEMVPLMLLFEGSIWLSVLLERRQAAPREALL